MISSNSNMITFSLFLLFSFFFFLSDLITHSFFEPLRVIYNNKQTKESYKYKKIKKETKLFFKTLPLSLIQDFLGEVIKEGYPTPHCFESTMSPCFITTMKSIYTKHFLNGNFFFQTARRAYEVHQMYTKCTC